jgi:hypothetical protein
MVVRTAQAVDCTEQNQADQIINAVFGHVANGGGIDVCCQCDDHGEDQSVIVVTLFSMYCEQVS